MSSRMANTHGIRSTLFIRERSDKRKPADIKNSSIEALKLPVYRAPIFFLSSFLSGFLSSFSRCGFFGKVNLQPGSTSDQLSGQKRNFLIWEPARELKGGAPGQLLKQSFPHRYSTTYFPTREHTPLHEGGRERISSSHIIHHIKHTTQR